MKLNVENIKVLRVEANGEVVVFKCDDIISLEYKSVSIKGRIAKISDASITVDCSALYNSQIHEVDIKDIENINKEEDADKKREEKVVSVKEALIDLEDLEEEELSAPKTYNKENAVKSEDRTLEPILSTKEKVTTQAVDSTDAEQDELDDSVSLFGNIKRNYAQGISPIFNK